MKYVKMLGLAAVAAMALMAFVGAGSASATVLCKGSTSPCTSLVTTVHGVQVGTGKLTATNGDVLDECKAATIEGDVDTQGATSTAHGGIDVLTWEECTKPTTTHKLGTLEVHHISKSVNGTVTASGTEVTISGIFGVTCVYGTGAGLDLGTLKGGSTPELVINAVVPKTQGGFLCPSHGVWEATFHLTEATNVLAS